jgi:uncharacterized membrane protein
MLKRLAAQFVILFAVVCAAMPATVTARDTSDYASVFAWREQGQANDEAVVRAVLFYSPSCPHCHAVITELLVPMIDTYGQQLQIAGIDTSQSGGALLYQAAIEYYEIPDERRGVPTLVVGDVVLVGGSEIPEFFPTMVEEGLAAGGIDWPDIPGLAEMFQQAEAEATKAAATTPTPPATTVSVTPTPLPATTTPVSSPTTLAGDTATTVTGSTATAVPQRTATPAPSVLTVGEDEILASTVQEPQSDPVGFALGGIVLVGMVLASGFAGWRLSLARRQLFRFDRNPGARVETRAVPLLVVLGLSVAGYLAYVEVNSVEAVCGPVGECNIVQTSAYAIMLGIPVAVWGVLNYLALGGLWIGQRYLRGQWAHLASLALLGLALFGTLFSIYLTCLELFVIRAICAWCLSSALITTLLMLLVVLYLTDGRSVGSRTRS